MHFGSLQVTREGKLTNKIPEVYINIVRAFEIGHQNTLYLTISKEARRNLDLHKGDKFLLKIDTKGRLVYEPIREHIKKRGANNER